MGEYDRKQQKPESRAIANNGAKNRQLKKSLDNQAKLSMRNVQIRQFMSLPPVSIPNITAVTIDAHTFKHYSALPAADMVTYINGQQGRFNGIQYNIPLGGGNFLGMTIKDAKAHISHYGPFGNKLTKQL